MRVPFRLWTSWGSRSSRFQARGPHTGPGIATNTANIATNIVVAALDKDILPLPAKKGDKFDALLSMVEEVADGLVVRYANAPALVDALVEAEESNTTNNNNNNYGSDVDDEWYFVSKW